MLYIIIISIYYYNYLGRDGNLTLTITRIVPLNKWLCLAASSLGTGDCQGRVKGPLSPWTNIINTNFLCDRKYYFKMSFRKAVF